jgi:alkanesulfonate monooxygenase SsuD/methylene tetrahydromethanopterin reductase-like flavin-dependent oxidoreductase (luciferase family)
VAVGLLTLGDLITDPITGERRTAAQRHRSIVNQAVLAEQVGFSSVHIGEHHFCDYIVSSPAVLLAAIAERTTTLKLSTGVTLGVNLDPLRIAEDYATVDVLSEGRVEPVIGRGTFFPHTYDGFGQQPAEAKAVFAEHLELLCRVLREENVTWSGEHRSPVTDLTTHPRPFHPGGPAMWVGAGVSMESIDLAARFGLRLMLPTVFGTPAMFRPAVDRYIEQLDRYGHDVAARRIGACHHTFVHADSAMAKARWEPRYRAYIEWVNDLVRWSTNGASNGLGTFDFDALTANTALCGSPDEVVNRMGELREALRLDTQILMLDMGGMPDGELFDAINLVGSVVLPQLD